MHTKANHIFIRVHAFRGEEFVLHALFLMIGLCVVGYAYFVSLSIINVIAHKEAIAQSESLLSEVGTLEEEYFELSKQVTPESGAHLGMTATSDTTFIRRPGAVGSVAGARTDI